MARDEKVINARHLTGQGPLWMLYEVLGRQTIAAVRLIVSDESTARHVVRALQTSGLSARIDHIGDEFHVLSQDLEGAFAGLLVTRRAEAREEGTREQAPDIEEQGRRGGESSV